MVFGAIRYQRRVAALNRELERIDRRYRAMAEVEKASVNVAPWSTDEGQARYLVLNKISVLETADLVQRALRQKVPIPDDDDQESWIEARGGGYYLSTFAYSNLRAAIRKERSEKWEFPLKVATLLGPMVTGVIGALIGLVAAFKK